MLLLKNSSPELGRVPRAVPSCFFRRSLLIPGSNRCLSGCMPYQDQPASLVVLSTFVQISGDIAHLDCGGVGKSVSEDFSRCFGISYQQSGREFANVRSSNGSNGWNQGHKHIIPPLKSLKKASFLRRMNDRDAVGTCYRAVNIFPLQKFKAYCQYYPCSSLPHASSKLS